MMPDDTELAKLDELFPSTTLFPLTRLHAGL